MPSLVVVSCALRCLHRLCRPVAPVVSVMILFALSSRIILYLHHVPSFPLKPQSSAALGLFGFSISRLVAAQTSTPQSVALFVRISPVCVACGSKLCLPVWPVRSMCSPSSLILTLACRPGGSTVFCLSYLLTKKKKKMEKDGRVGGRKNRGEEQSEVWWLNGL